MDRFALPALVLTASLFMSACGESPRGKTDAGDASDSGSLNDPHACEDRADGTPCGDNAICLEGECAPSVCGDGYVDVALGEECDDQNSTEGDGCENDCRFTCRSDADCQDGNPCNGEERCIDAGFGKLCAVALEPLNCDRGQACTLYRCDPTASNPEEACIAEPIDTNISLCWRDADGDGHPSYAGACNDPDAPSCENGIRLSMTEESPCGCPAGFIPADRNSAPEDCDDDDPETYPGAPELCGDWKDNDCANGHENIKPYPAAILEFCAVDADQDGYPDPDAEGDLRIASGYECVCPAGMTRIQESRSTQPDCDPTNHLVNPGITAYSPVAYCPGINELADSFLVTGRGRVFYCSDASVTPSFDFNCDGEETRQHNALNHGVCGTLCRSNAWTEKIPDCGQDAEFLSCRRRGKDLGCRANVTEARTAACR